MSYERLIYDHNIVGSKQRQTMHSLWFLRGLPFLIRPLEIEDRAACYTFDRTNLWVHRTLKFLGYALDSFAVECKLSKYSGGGCVE